MKRAIAFLALVTAAAPAAAASNYHHLQIEQRESAPASVEYSQIPSNNAQPQQSPSPSYNQEIRPNKPPVPANVQWDLYNQIQQLQQELSELRGLLEQQAHELAQYKEQEYKRYQDLDYRLNNIQSAPQVEQVDSSNTAEVNADGADLQASGNDKELYDKAKALILKERKYQQATGILENLLATTPESEWAAPSMYWLASIYMLIDPPDYDKAKSHLIALLRDHRDHQKVPDALLKLGKLYDLMGEKDKARITLQKVVEDYPKRAAANHAKKLLQKL